LDISIAPANTIVATDLSNGTSYYFRVQASNVAGYGLNSAVVTRIPYTVPDKVGAITVTPLAASVSLAWPTTTASNGTAITSYYYYWSLSGSGTFTAVSNSSNTFAAVKSSLSNGQTYNFYVAASNAAGFGLSSDIVSTIPRTTPGTPTTISAVVLTYDSVSVSFVAPASNGGNAITSYIVTPFLGGTVAQESVSGAQSPIVVGGRTPGLAYTYKVVASNEAGTSVTPGTSSSVSTYYNSPVENPNGNTYTYYVSNAIARSKVPYSLNYSNVDISQVSTSVWSVSYEGLVDTLNYVRKIELLDRNVWIMDISYGATLGGKYDNFNTATILSNGDVLKVGSGEYLADTEPTILKSITIEGPPDRSAIFGVIPPRRSYCLKIEGNDIIARNLTLATGYYTPSYTVGDYSLLAAGKEVSGVVPSLSNILIENITITNPYTLNSDPSELQYWRNRRGSAFNSISGLTIRNCEFPKTWNFDLTLASCKNVVVSSNTFYACPWSTIAIVTTNEVLSTLSEYESSNINIAADNTFQEFGDPSITTIIANPSYGQGETSATYITPLQNPVLTFQTTASYAITYSSNAGSTVQIPADFRYSFVSSPLLAYVAREPLDLPASFWAGTAQSVVVTDLSENVQIYPPGYCPLSNRNIYRPTLVLTPSLTKGDVTITVNPLIEYATYTFSIDASEVQTSNTSGSYTFLGATLSDGQHIVTVTGTDGVVTSDTSVVYFTFDSTPPAINLISASIPDLSGQVIVNFDVSDGAGIVACTTYVNDVSYADGLVFPLTVNLSYQVYGDYTIKVGATDSLGNSGFSSPISLTYAQPATPVMNIAPGQEEVVLFFGGNNFVAPITSNVEETVASGGLANGGILIIDNGNGVGTAAVFTDAPVEDIGSTAVTAFEGGLSTLVIGREDDSVIVASIGSAAEPLEVESSLNGIPVSVNVDTSSVGSNLPLFAFVPAPPPPIPQANFFFKVFSPQGEIVPGGFEIPMAMNLPQFSRLSELGMQRSVDGGVTYDYVSNVPRDPSTGLFVPTFTQNSDYRLARAYGSGIGDPYIMTVGGNLYKIPPFNGPMRLYQGKVGNQLLTVNATTRIDDDKAAMDGDTNAVIQTLTKPTGPHNFTMTDAMSFFEKIYIRFGSKSMTVNVYNNEFRVEGPETWQVKNAGRVEKVGNTFDFYSNLSARNYDICPCPGVTVRIGIIPIRNVRSFVDIIAPNMEGGNGAFVHRLSRKAMTLRKLASEAPVERRDCPIKRTLGEVFVCNEFTKEKQIPFVG
jgi:hypothetical protein